MNQNPGESAHTSTPHLQSSGRGNKPVRILMRAGKDPFTAVTPEELVLNAPTAGLFGKNAGNMLFQDAMHRVLSTEGSQVMVDQVRTELAYRPVPVEPYGPIATTVQSIKRTADYINANFDVLVLPLANAFRRSLAGSIGRLTEIIKLLKIPVVVVGVGVQRKLQNAHKPLPDDIVKLATEFVGAVLEHSASIGVRGEITKDNLVALGFDADRVDVIGCPSLFAQGTDISVTRKVDRLTAESEISINVSPYVAKMNDFALSQFERFPNMVYIPQVVEDLKLMLWAQEPSKLKPENKLQTTRSPYYVHDRMRLFTDSRAWIDYLATKEFSVGSRIHGNIAALRAGTPAFVLAHDSRTLEIAQYYSIPHLKISALKADTTIEQLYDQADYTEFNANHPARLETFVEFLNRNGLPNIYTHAAESDVDAYATKLAAVPMAEPVTVQFPNGPGDAATAQFDADRQTHKTYLAGLPRGGRPTLTKRIHKRLPTALKRYVS